MAQLKVVEEDLNPLEYIRSEEVESVARELRKRHGFKFAHLDEFEVVYLLRRVEGELEEKQLDAIANAVKAPAIWRDVASVDACIWIDKRYWDRFDATQREAVVLHELLHLGVNDADKLKLLDHDVEDFGMVVRLYGPWHPPMRHFAEQLALFEPVVAKTDPDVCPFPGCTRKVDHAGDHNAAEPS